MGRGPGGSLQWGVPGHAWEALNPVKEEDEDGWSSPVRFPEGLPRFGFTANAAAVGNSWKKRWG
eukprot:10806967-Prorocentrum_lima.AAC.1